MATATAQGGPSPAAKADNERIVYRAGGGRRFAFAFVFLLLLPFYVSLPAMLLQRIGGGLWADTLALLVIAAAFTVLMALILVELLSSIRTRIDIGGSAVKLTVPGAAGPTPKFSYKTHDIPYDQIKAIETRREIYGGALTPVQLRGARLVKKDGTIVPLGFVSEANMDPAFPYLEIAGKISERAGVPLSDMGAVRRSFRRRLLGLATIPGPEENFDESHIEALNKQHNKVVLALIFFLVALVGTGILSDIVADWNSAPPAEASSKGGR